MTRFARVPRYLVACLLLAVVAAASATTASAQSAPTVVILVRHGEKAMAPADDPPLTEAGAARAKALAEALADANVRAIISTPLARTRQTAQPLADARHLTVEIVPTGDREAHARAVADAVRRHAGQTVLVVGHSNTIAPIIAALGGPALPDICDTQYSDMFTLIIEGKTVSLIRSTYGAPSPDRAKSCPKLMK